MQCFNNKQIQPPWCRTWTGFHEKHTGNCTGKALSEVQPYIRAKKENRTVDQNVRRAIKEIPTFHEDIFKSWGVDISYLQEYFMDCWSVCSAVSNTHRLLSSGELQKARNQSWKVQYYHKQIWNMHFKALRGLNPDLDLRSLSFDFQLFTIHGT